jgi:hypothetical protein
MTLHCTTPTRIDLLFTMSDNPRVHVKDNGSQSDVSRTNCLPVRRTARLRPSGLRRGSLRASSGPPSRSACWREGWWSLSGSNRRPHACKARALPAELRPHNRKDECVAAEPSRRSANRSSRRQACRAKAGKASEGWWAWEDLNFRPHAYQARALTN